MCSGRHDARCASEGRSAGCVRDDAITRANSADERYANICRERRSRPARAPASRRAGRATLSEGAKISRYHPRYRVIIR